MLLVHQSSDLPRIVLETPRRRTTGARLARTPRGPRRRDGGGRSASVRWLRRAAIAAGRAAAPGRRMHRNRADALTVRPRGSGRHDLREERPGDRFRASGGATRYPVEVGRNPVPGACRQGARTPRHRPRCRILAARWFRALPARRWVSALPVLRNAWEIWIRRQTSRASPQFSVTPCRRPVGSWNAVAVARRYCARSPAGTPSGRSSIGGMAARCPDATQLRPGSTQMCYTPRFGRMARMTGTPFPPACRPTFVWSSATGRRGTRRGQGATACCLRWAEQLSKAPGTCWMMPSGLRSSVSPAMAQ